MDLNIGRANSDQREMFLELFKGKTVVLDPSDRPGPCVNIQ